MRKFQLVMAVITSILMFSTLVCGLWIRSNFVGGTVPESSIIFHMQIGIATAVAVFITLITIFIRK